MTSNEARHAAARPAFAAGTPASAAAPQQVTAGSAAAGPAGPRGRGDAPPSGESHADASEALARLEASRQGLTAGEAARRLAEAGPNAIPEEHRSLLRAGSPARETGSR